MNQLLTSPEHDTLHKRLLSLMGAAAESATEFLHLSRLGTSTKVLIDQAAVRILKHLEKTVTETSEDDIRKQILYIRDEVIPYLLGEEQHGELPAKD